MEKKLLKSLLSAVMFMLAVGVIFVSCKDNDNEMYYDLQGQIGDVDSKFDALYKAQAEDLGKLQDALTAAKSDCEKQIADVNTALNTAIQNLQKDITDNQKLQSDTLNEKIEKNVKSINGLTTITEELKAQDVVLENMIKDLQETVDANNQAMLDSVKNIYDAIKNIDVTNTTIVNVRNDITNINENITNINENITTINESIKEAESKIDQALEVKIPELKTEVDKNIQALQAQINALNTRADSISGAYAAAKEAKDKADVNAATIEQMQTNVKNLQDAMAAIKSCNCDCAALQALIDKNTTRIAALDDSIANLKIQAEENLKTAKLYADAQDQVIMKALGDSVNNLNGSIGEVSDSLGRLNGVVNTLNGIVNTLGDSIANVYNTLNGSITNINGSITNIKDSITNINGSITDINGSITNINGSITNLNERIDSVILVVEAAKTAFNNALNDSVAKLRKEIEANTTAINNVKNDLNGVVEALNKRISSIVLQGAYSPVVGYFATPTGTKSNILAAYYGAPKKDVVFPTMSTVNETNSKITHIPFEIGLKLGFSTEDGSYKEKVEILANQTLVAGEGNAGKLYMTVNPAEVDLSETKFSLVNSIGDSYAELGTPNKSDYKLTFGYVRANDKTRAGKQNGFYEALATIPAENIADAKLRVEFEAVKEVIRDVKSFGNGVNVTKMITTLYDVMNDIADANAVEAVWEDSLGEHSVYSDYGIAAVAVKPLSYNFMADQKDVTEFPGISRVSNFVNNLIDKIDINIPDFNIKDLKVPEIKKIEIKELSPELLAKFKITITKTVEYRLNMEVSVDDVIVDGQDVSVPGTEVKVPEQKITVPGKWIDVELADGSISSTWIEPQEVTVPAQTVKVDGQTVYVDGQVIKVPNVKVDKVLEIPVEIEYDMTDAVEDLYGEMTGSIEDVNAMLGDLESFMDDINGMLDDLKELADIENSINEAKDKIKNEINGYIEELNNKLCKLINSVNAKMQPTMLVKTTDGFRQLSTIKSNPSKFNAASAVLVPTSYNAELLAPAYKKFIIVTNVFKAGNYSDNAQAGCAECMSVLEAANNAGDLNSVLDGTVREVSFEGQKGYVYEILYQAVDFSGFISNTKYYVTIK